MKLYQYIWRTTKGYRLRFFLLFVTVMAATAAEAMIPAVIGGIVDQIFYLRSLKGFLLCFFWYAGIYLFNQTMHGCLNYLWAKLKVTYVVDIRRECFDHLLRLKSERLSDMKSGDVFRRIQDDAEAFLALIHWCLFYVLGNLLQLFISVIYLLHIDRYLGLVAVILSPLMAFSLKKFGSLLKRKQTEIQREKGFLEAWIFELIDGMREWKLLNSGEWVKRQYLKKTRSILSGEKTNAYMEIAADGVNGGITLAGQLMIYLISALRIAGGGMTVGQFVASASYYTSCARYFNAIGQKISAVSANLASTERVFDFMSWEEETDRPGAKERPVTKGEIVFDRVSFCYGNTPVLREVSFSAASGEKTAIVGRSGEGKSTLLSLICRLYDPLEGRIRIDGQDIETFTLRSLRKQIGVVQQSSSLFAGSIRKNITFSDDPGQDGRVWELLKGLKMDDVIRQYSDGLDTMVDDGENAEGYVSLSGGQKQRIAIARALYKRPAVLLLDEATSSLDEKTEKDVYQYILETLPDVTLLSVSHRFSTVLKADRILVMEDGRISAQGTNEELLRKSAVYSGLYEEYRRASSEKRGEGTR